MKLRVIDPKLYDLMQYSSENFGVSALDVCYTTFNLEESVKCSIGGANLGRPRFSCCVLVNSKIKN